VNSTNRGFNRGLILIVGFVLLAGGLSSIALSAIPAFAELWVAQGQKLTGAATDGFMRISVGTATLADIAVGVFAVILAVVLILFISREGGGRTSTLVEQSADGSRTTRIELGVPRALLQGELSGRPEFVSTRVSAHTVSGTATLNVSVRCRRGIAPADATAIVTRALLGMDQILGTTIPTLVQVGGGFRARFSTRSRLN
jgi:hypothetical protein